MDRKVNNLSMLRLYMCSVRGWTPSCLICAFRAARGAGRRALFVMGPWEPPTGGVSMVPTADRPEGKRARISSESVSRESAANAIQNP